MKLELTYRQAELMAETASARAAMYENPADHDPTHKLFANDGIAERYREKAATLREIESACRDAIQQVPSDAADRGDDGR